MTALSPTEILALPVDGESGATTIRGFLTRVLAETWENQKRVFGESSWRYEAYEALVKAGLVEGVIDEDGYLDSMDEAAAEKAMTELIKSLETPA